MQLITARVDGFGRHLEGLDILPQRAIVRGEVDDLLALAAHGLLPTAADSVPLAAARLACL